jgi:hypothetical protein
MGYWELRSIMDVYLYVRPQSRSSDVIGTGSGKPREPGEPDMRSKSTNCKQNPAL